jgi:peptide/nickel transport system substrate-binding protein
MKSFLNKAFSTLTCVLLVAALVTVSCTNQRSPEEKRNQLIIAYGDTDQIKTFDPTRQQYSFEAASMMQVLEPLVRFGQDLKLKPVLATNWETPDNCNTWIFDLREGVTFHDGTPFNAEAVKKHFDRTLDPATAATRRKVIPDLKEVTTEGDYRVLFHMMAPNCVFPEKIASAFGVIPSPTAIETMVTKDENKFARNPIGTGPFKFIEWTPDEVIRFEKYDDYWNADAYHIEKLEIHKIVENTTRLILLEQGVVDLTPIAFAQVAVAKQTEDIVVQSVPFLSIRYIGFNTQKPPFDDKRVRQAANYAVNKEDLVKYMFFGVGEPARGPMPPVMPAYNHEMRTYEYNPEKAKELLKEAGYDTNYRASFWTRETGEYSVASQGVLGYLSDVGIKCDMNVLENAVYWSKFDKYLTRDGQMFPKKEGVYEIYVGGWVGGETAHGFLEPLFMAGSYSNSSFYNNPEVNRLLKEFKKLPNPEDRDKVYKQIQAIIMEDAPWIFAFHGQNNIGLRKRVKGFQVSPAGWLFLEGVRVDDSADGDGGAS